jgi:hypothetical protein
MFPPHCFQENFVTFSRYFLNTSNKLVLTVSTKLKKGIPKARQFFFQINTVIESKLLSVTIAYGTIHTLQKPVDWPEKKVTERRG